MPNQAVDAGSLREALRQHLSTLDAVTSPPGFGVLLSGSAALDQKIARCEYIRNITEAAGKDVLDFGSGGGLLAAVLGATGARSVVGVEVNEDWRSQSDQLAGQLGLTNTSFVGEMGTTSFDVAILTNVVTHIYPPIQVLLGVSDRIRPGGLLFVEDNNNLSSPLFRRSWRRLVRDWTLIEPGEANGRRQRIGDQPDAEQLARLTYGMTYEQMDYWIKQPRVALARVHDRLRQRAPLNPDDGIYHENAFHPDHLRTIVENMGFVVWWIRPKHVFDVKRRPVVSAAFRRFPRLGMRLTPGYELLATKV